MAAIDHAAVAAIHRKRRLVAEIDGQRVRSVVSVSVARPSVIQA